MRAVLAVADDLSGAAEVACHLIVRALRTEIVLDDGVVVPSATCDLPVIDTDSRQLPPSAAATRVGSALGRFARDSSIILKKVDSLLRGNLAAELTAVLRRPAGNGPGVRVAVIATALPALGRTVVGGVARVGGVPLRETAAWRLERAAAPESVAGAVRPLPTRLIGLDVVRAGQEELARRLARAAADGVSPICDAETDDDLDRVVAAAIGLPRLTLVGSGGLAAALGRHLARPPADEPTTGEPDMDEPDTGEPGADQASRTARRTEHEGAVAPRGVRRGGAAGGLLVVVGTADPGARAQVGRLVAMGVTHLPLSLGGPATDAGLPGRIRAALDRGPAVLTIDPDGGLVPERARTLAGELADVVRDIPSISACDLVLTGGETARRVLQALGVNSLRPVREIHPGAVHSVTGDGRSVVTRPGSFGGQDSLTRIMRALRPPGHARTITNERRIP
ncbi:four-carbon acid sugar kinase family protein [Streptosporangium soli]|nr:hypothetical protein [Streptosporangium sp. KLBMP 9127]